MSNDVSAQHVFEVISNTTSAGEKQETQVVGVIPRDVLKMMKRFSHLLYLRPNGTFSSSTS